MSKTIIRPPREKEKFDELLARAAEDKAFVYYPTHIIEKDGEVIGFFSIGANPVILAHFDRQKCSAKDTIKAIEIGENFMRALGHKNYTLLCETESPFYPLLEKMGYKNIMPTNMMSKNL
jgi:hypothetical protein